MLVHRTTFDELVAVITTEGQLFMYIRTGIFNRVDAREVLAHVFCSFSTSEAVMSPNVETAPTSTVLGDLESNGDRHHVSEGLLLDTIVDTEIGTLHLE